MALKIFEIRAYAGLTDSYHSGGVAVVVAESEAEARGILDAHIACREEVPEEALDTHKEAYVHEIKAGVLIIGADRGCC